MRFTPRRRRDARVGVCDARGEGRTTTRRQILWGLGQKPADASKSSEILFFGAQPRALAAGRGNRHRAACDSIEPRALEASRRDAGRADSGSEAGRRSRRIPNSRWRTSTRRSGRAARSACASPPLDRFRLGTSPQELVASKEPGSPLVAPRFPPPRSERSTPPPSPRSCDRAPDNDIARLKRAYTNEKCAPELLPFEADLVSRVTEQVEHQEGTVSSARAAAAAGSGAGADDLMAHIYHAELNRVRFLLRAYYRTRLFKIERNAVHVLKEPEVLERLSEQEREYATNYANAVEEHFGAALGQMPDRYASMLQQIEEEDGEWDMVPPPTSTRTSSLECAKIAESSSSTPTTRKTPWTSRRAISS